jgi:hypothetical protein
MPDTIPNASSTFLSWVRQGAAGTIQNADTLSPTQPGRISVPVKLRINNVQDVSVTVGVLGPGEVTGLDRQQVVRTEPKAGTATFEPNYLAAIEFDRPDLPWLFTPAKAGTDGKLRPWLCLVVVKKQPGVSLRPDRSAPLPILEIGAPARPGDELPDLAESWAWAHAQISAAQNATPAELTQILATRPELSVSRLLCPRLLQPLTDYLACLVPSFEPGRKAGLNLPVQPTDTLAPAWLPPATQVTLPVFYHWEFRTSAAGDFESLVRLLTPRRVPNEVGKRPMIVSTDLKLPPTPSSTTVLELEGALRVLDSPQSPWPDAPRKAFQQALKKILNKPATTQAVPLLAPPIYGGIYAGVTQVDNAASPLPWVHELNLDPRERVVAALGTLVVQSQQEELMASAWEQMGEIERANQRLRQEQLSLTINTVLHVKHFARLGEDALLQVAAPAQARIVWADPPQPDGTPTKPLSLQQRIANAVIPSDAIESATRRLTRSRGPISRRAAVQGGQRTGAFISKLNRPRPAPPSEAAGPITGPITINRVSATIPALAQRVRFELASDQAVRAAPQAPVMPFILEEPLDFDVAEEGKPMPLRRLELQGLDSEAARNFRKAAEAHQAGVNPIGISIFVKPPPPLPPVKASLLKRLDPAGTVTLRVQATIRVTPSPGSPQALRAAPSSDLRPILAAPEFPQPMYEVLRDLSQDLLLPGMEHVPPNTITLLETNAKFVESFMVGLNTEMGRELLWRGFPTDQRGTYFQQFWDAPPREKDPINQPGVKVPQPDIEPIDQWDTKELGKNFHQPPGGGNLALLIRGELLRRYPNAVIYAAEAISGSDGKRAPGPNEKYPIFRGTLQPDITFLGFDLTSTMAKGNPGWFFIIQEQPTEPRFGFDEDVSFGTRTHASVAEPPPASLKLPPGAVWRKNSAHMACIARQQPVRIAIHATQMIP